MQSELLAIRVERLVASWVNALPRTDVTPIDTYYEMVREHPVVAAAADLRIFLGVSMLGEFTHPDEGIQEEGRKAIANSKGSWLGTLSKMMTFVPYGYSFTEIAYEIESKATIKELYTLDPRKYYFEGTEREPKKVVYQNIGGDIKIDYASGIHLANQQHLIPGEDPYGIALCRRALRYWRLYETVMVALAIASQRQATPIIVGKTETSGETDLLDENGQPLINQFTGQKIQIRKGESLHRKLREIENTSVIVIDRLDEILAIAQQTTGEFFASVLHYLESMMLLSFLVPQTVTGTSESGTGDSNLNEGHRETLRLVTRSQMGIVGDALIEKLMRPMIEFNHGSQDSYGTFPLPTEDNEDTIQLLDAIGNAIARGAFSAEDMAVINRMRQLAGIHMI